MAIKDEQVRILFGKLIEANVSVPWSTEEMKEYCVLHCLSNIDSFVKGVKNLKEDLDKMGLTL